MKQTEAFKKSIYRLIIKRLFWVSTLIAVLFSVVSYYHSKQMVYDAVVHVSSAQITFIKGKLLEYIKTHPEKNINSALQSAISYSPATELHIKEGEFVYVVLYDEKFEKIAIHEHKGIQDKETIENYIFNNIKGHTPHNLSETEFQSTTINGKNYIEIHDTVLTDHEGAVISLRALFALSDLADQSIRNFTLKNILLVIFIVGGTTLFLFPVVTMFFQRIANYSCRLLTAHIQTMQALGEAIAKRDIDTSYHNYRVTLYSVILAEYIGFPQEKMKSLIKGSFLHDVGKIGIRDDILLTNKRFSPEQRDIMKSHVTLGIDIISRSNWLQDAADIVAHHHEKFDGSGYPANLKGKTIPEGARIFAIVDIFDALTSRRPYKEPLSYADTISCMEKDFDGHFDPEIFKNFIKIAEELYSEYAGREDELVKEQFEGIINKYFFCDYCS